MIAKFAEVSRVLPLVCSVLLPTALTPLPATAQASAQESATYVIGSTEGYGVGECFASGMACGRVVADAWCEAHGRGKATAFGLASDVAVIITCGE